MSLQKRMDSLLKGFQGPVFTQEATADLDRLNALYSDDSDLTWNGVHLVIAGRGVIGYRIWEPDPITLDGFLWYSALYFTTPSGGAIAVLFPWKTDESLVDGSSQDCSIAVYIRGGATKYEAVLLCADLANSMERVKRANSIRAEK